MGRFMRSTIAILLLTTLVSCVTKTEEKSCKLNGTPVACEGESVTRADAPEPQAPGIVSVNLSTVIHRLPYEIEYLENVAESEEFEGQGGTYSCELKTEVATRITYRISGSQLILMKEKFGQVGLEVYERISGQSGELDGIWQNQTRLPGRLEVTQLRFEGETLTMKRECHFK